MADEELNRRIHFGFKLVVNHHLNLQAFAQAAEVTAGQVLEDKMHAAHVADLKARLVLEQLDGVDAMVVDTPSQPTEAVGAAVQATQTVAPATSLPSPSVNAQLTTTYNFIADLETSRGTKRIRHSSYEENEEKRRKPNPAADEQSEQAVANDISRSSVPNTPSAKLPQTMSQSTQ